MLEYVIRDVYERRINEPPGTRPLENLLQRIGKDGHFPDRLDAYANTIRKLGNVGTHAFGEKVTAADVRQSLTQLMPILEWFFEIERPEALAGKRPAQPRPPRVAGGFSLTSKDQNGFLGQAVRGLAQDGKVVCVRLALFTEMMKGRAWTPAALREVGGAEGVGVAFLEETFSAATAPPEHRYHQKAARAVLKSLLPESGTDIKGHMRSRQELLEASGCASRPRDFEDLLRVLDGELRLITPTDPEGKEDACPSAVVAGTRYYQLTHDYLVPSLRDWLTRKQKETRRGRAELLLADRAAVWNVRPENRQLPSLWQWLGIRWLTAKKDWTPPQRKMMARAGRYHALRGLVLAVVLVGLSAAGLVVRGRVVERDNARHAAGLVQRLLDAETPQVPGIVAEMEGYQAWTDPLLREERRKAQPRSRPQLHASLALLPVDSTQVDYLYGRLLDAQPHEVAVLRDALAPHKGELLDRLWSVAARPGQGREGQRLRAAAALAKYDPDGRRWEDVRDAVAGELVRVPAVYLVAWLESFRPVRTELLPPLAAIFRETGRRDAERSLATEVLADYAADRPKVLADLLMDADERQFAAIFLRLKDCGEQAVSLLTGEIDRTLPSDLPSSDEKRERLAKRQASAAVALLRMNRSEKVWPLLKRGDKPDDPRVRSYLIHWLAPRGADAGALVKRLDEEPDVTVRRALLLGLGEYGPDRLPAAGRERLLGRVVQLYRDDPDPGLHGAAEWLLRQWNQDGKIREIGAAWVKGKKQRAERLEHVERELFQGRTNPQWYVNGQGQTMVVLPGPVEFLMGSPPTEPDREGGPTGTIEQQHRKRIGHSFAIATREVTVEQFLRFRKDHVYNKQYSPTLDCPVNIITWYDAAAYCNWLSKQEGIRKEQWCYLPNDKDEYAEGMKLASDYLNRTGYRLPSEAEWEYACRARAVTGRYYGESEELLGKYAWYTTNSKDRCILPGVPGQLGVRGNWLKPNDFGLFDTLGNALEWCQDSVNYYTPGEKGKPSEDVEDTTAITDKRSRVLRGGSFNYRSRSVRCAYRIRLGPTYRANGAVGFRPARTFAP